MSGSGGRSIPGSNSVRGSSSSAGAETAPARKRTSRSAGVLLHPSSLPGPFPIGDFGPASTRFLDWAASAGVSLWQILPLTPTGPGDSPYSGTSAFAGNALLVSPERLADDGWIAAGDLAAVRSAPSTPSGAPVDFAAAARGKARLLRDAWTGFRAGRGNAGKTELEAFREGSGQRPWLADWSLFSALKSARRGASWPEWEPALARREPAALEKARRDLAEEVAFEEFVQFLFFRQWDGVRSEAALRGIEILGDLPIYVAHDSADVWAHPELFALDRNGLPERVAGVPPDYFSETGQLWGYPVYRWDACAREGYAWWIERLRANLRLVDGLRIDHFRGFEGFWEVPAGEKTAIAGRWSPGPGRALFEAATRALGPLPIVAEDLGTITEDVAVLLAQLGIPGMKVLQFAFSEDDSPHLPHRHPENALVYTGTHDNDTSLGWAATLSKRERERYREYAGGDAVDPSRDLIRLALTSVARLAVVPMQDVFGLGSEARMNTPGRATGNWTWRARAEDFTPERAASILELARLTGRA